MITAFLIAMLMGQTGVRSIDPYDAYAEGDYEAALEGFTQESVRRPHDPELMMNTGSTLYQLGRYAEADQAWQQAARAKDPKFRGEAQYALGNSAFRQGKLEAAVEHYKQALKHNAKDQDAKFNLEFAQRELERRKQESKKNPPSDDTKKDESESQDAQQKSDEGDKSGGAEQKQPGEKPEDEKNQADEKGTPGEQKPAGGQPGEAPQEISGAAQGGTMTRAEAERILDALAGDRLYRPKERTKAKNAPIFRQGKDW